MSVNSLPSFAQAFSTHSLASIQSNANLPPIIPRNSRKRDRNHSPDTESVPFSRISDGPPHPSPPPSPPLAIKQEADDGPVHNNRTDSPLAPPPAPPSDYVGAPPPSSLMPSASKKRRVTVSGSAPHPLNIDLIRPPPPDQASSTPISPVVMGFTVQRDNPGAMEQVRSMLNVKQKQKALIEQRRGSTAGGMSPVATTPIDSKLNPSPAPPTRSSRRSPNNNSNTPKRQPNQSRGPPSPPPPAPVVVHQQQQPQQPPQQHQPLPPQPQHSLPPPPISFAKRRAAALGGKKKPADIVISPRDTHTRQLQPSVQSAPPTQNTFNARFPSMALPRLPSIIGQSDNVRKVASNVPPTPTRLSMMQQQQLASAANPSATHPSGTTLRINAAAANSGTSGIPPALPNRSPPASVPIASTLVPPTPTSLHRPGYGGDKAAFLAPFEVFYDALNDSKQLKGWLQEQLSKSQMLMQSLTAQQERMHETVETMVEAKVGAMKKEVVGLRRRVDELEELVARGSKLSNGLQASHPQEPYTFPPASHMQERDLAPPSLASSSRLGVRPDFSRRLSSPGWAHGRDRDGYSNKESRERERDRDVDPRSESPVPYDSRRMSVTVPTLPPLPSAASQSRTEQRDQRPSAMPSPSHSHSHPHPYREREGGHKPSALSRANSNTSSPVVPVVVVNGDKEREPTEEREREREREPRERGRDTTPRRASSRRNSVTMGSPDIKA